MKSGPVHLTGNAPTNDHVRTVFSVWSNIVSVSSRRSIFSRHAANHFVNSSLLVMPRFSTRFGNFARPRSLWTKSLTPPSLYSSTSYSIASPETSVK